MSWLSQTPNSKSIFFTIDLAAILLSSFIFPITDRSKSPPRVSRCLHTSHALSHYSARFFSFTRRAPKHLFPHILFPSYLFSICSCYSAYEHSKFHETSPRTSYLGSTGSAPTPPPRLPLDISLETIFSVFLVCVGLVLGAEELKPITWRVWAGKAERESRGGGPFQALEERLGFMDIRVGVFSFSFPLAGSYQSKPLFVFRR